MIWGVIESHAYSSLRRAAHFAECLALAEQVEQLRDDLQGSNEPLCVGTACYMSTACCVGTACWLATQS